MNIVYYIFVSLISLGLGIYTASSALGISASAFILANFLGGIATVATVTFLYSPFWLRNLFHLVQRWTKRWYFRYHFNKVYKHKH